MIVEFSRRKFLVAAGGAALALPVLEALTPRTALAAYDETRRILFYLTANGTRPEGRPKGTGFNYELGLVHEGLSKHKADMLHIAGLDGTAATMSNGDPHGCGMAAMLSGRKCLPGDLFKNFACFQDPECPGTGWGDGPSLDYELGQQQLAAKVPIVHGMLNFSVRNSPGTLATRSSYSGPGKPIAPFTDPQAVFDTIFGMPGVPDAKAARQALRRTTILDALKTDITALQRNVSTSDRARLDQHLTSLRELELSLNATRPNSACVSPLRPSRGASPLIDRNAGSQELNWKDDDSENLPVRHKVWRELMIAALACDLTRVITFIAEPGGSDTLMPWLAADPNYPGNFLVPHHSASHAQDTPSLIAMDHWYATQISALVDDLKGTKGSDGKPLFETSAVAWFNEQAEGSSHSQVNKPHTIVGSLGGYFKTGQVVQYPQGTPHNVLLAAVAQGMGMQTDHYGGSEEELQGGDIRLVKS